MTSTNKKLSSELITSYLNDIENAIIHKGERKTIELSCKWVDSFPAEAGVYVVFDRDKAVYAGETGNIRGRMRDLLDSRHHTLRRSVGKINFHKENGYKNADTKNKFPEHIEQLVTQYITDKFRLCHLAVSLGRKELEERIISKYKPQYNQKGQRTSR